MKNRFPIVTRTAIKTNESFVGETIESRVARLLTNNEPITEGTPMIYTERKDGVNPFMDIRTDIWDMAVDTTDKNTREALAKRDELHNPKDESETKGTDA